MFGLPIWAIQLIIAVLRQLGLINWASALSLKLGLKLLKTLENVKTYHENNDFPQPFPATLTPNNLAPQQVQ